MEEEIYSHGLDFDEFCRYREQYNNQIIKIQRKMDYFLFRDKNFIKEDTFLEDMFLESILVDVRALLMENARYKKNYTLQNSFRLNSDNEKDINFKIACEIDNLLNDTYLPDGETSFFEAVKFYTDKYIAHRDNTSTDDDEKKIRIKSAFLNNEEFGLVFTVKAIIEIAKDMEQKIQIAVLEELTKCPEGFELLDVNAVEPLYSLDREIDIDRDINPKLIDEILKKAPKDIAYLIGFDVRGLKIDDVNSPETRAAVSNYVKGISNSRERLEFICKVKETPNI